MTNCRQCKTDFKIPEVDREFHARLEVPAPTLCPDCRRCRRLAFWPYGIFRKRKCDLSGEQIITVISPERAFPVYKKDHWFSDNWNPPEQEIDWDRPFFDQLYELQEKTPHAHKLGKGSTNCEYADDTWYCKNAYLSRSMSEIEDMYYVYRVLKSRNCIDITYCFEMEECYECTYCFKCYNLKFSSHSRGCSDSYFLYDCKNCSNCFMCWNLRNQKYCIMNQQYSKEDYEAKLKELKLNSRNALKHYRTQFEDLIRAHAYHRASLNTNIENCQGNYMTNCKNCRECYYWEDNEDCAYGLRGAYGAKDSMDTCGQYSGELQYECCQMTHSINTKFSLQSIDCFDCEYIDHCCNSNNLFGCVGLKRREYCILNKQYSKEEYFELKARLIEHMKFHNEYGEFFPYKFAYVGFNLSLAGFYYDTPEGVADEEEPKSDLQGTPSTALPDTSQEITDDWIGKPINCSLTGKPYSFIKKELDFYRQHNLPLPEFYPEERNRRRFTQMMAPFPNSVACFTSQKQITSYHPPRLNYEKILCEDCYLKTVY